MLSDPGEQRSTYHIALLYIDFCRVNSIVLPFVSFEAQSLQLALTAYCLDPSVLNLWSYLHRPRVLYPAAGLPYWSGILTRWNSRPCLAALTPVISRGNLAICIALGLLNDSVYQQVKFARRVDGAECRFSREFDGKSGLDRGSMVEDTSTGVVEIPILHAGQRFQTRF